MRSDDAAAPEQKGEGKSLVAACCSRKARKGRMLKPYAMSDAVIGLTMKKARHRTSRGRRWMAWKLGVKPRYVREYETGLRKWTRQEMERWAKLLSEEKARMRAAKAALAASGQEIKPTAPAS